jgi:hypothetical protein
MTNTHHQFSVGDKIQFAGHHSEFNRRFIANNTGNAPDGIVTVTEVVTQPDGYGDIAHYVRLAEDPMGIGDEAPMWNVNWFNPTPIAQEATMTDTTRRSFNVGDKVRVTNERTTIGGPAPHEKGTYVGATATVTEVLHEDDNEYDGSYALEFDDSSLSNFGSWSTAALDLVEEYTTERPTIDFSGSSRSTAREYAKDANTRLLSSTQQAVLRQVAAGEEVDAYTLNEVLLAAMRASLTRHGASTQRRVTGRKIAYLGHITQAVLENHAQGLPAYEKGERSPALAAAREEVTRYREGLEEANRERGLLTQAASDERRRLCAEIDELRAHRRDLAEERSRLKHEHAAYKRAADNEVSRLLTSVKNTEEAHAETVKKRDEVASVLDYAMGRLSDTDKQRVLGYWDGVAAE